MKVLPPLETSVPLGKVGQQMNKGSAVSQGSARQEGCAPHGLGVRDKHPEGGGT